MFNVGDKVTHTKCIGVFTIVELVPAGVPYYHLKCKGIVFPTPRVLLDNDRIVCEEFLTLI